MKKHLFIIAFIFSQLAANAQVVKKTIYYDYNWKVVPGPINAHYYREYRLDENHKIMSGINDYLMNGRLRRKIDGALKIDDSDDSKSLFKGHCITYFEVIGVESDITYDPVGAIIHEKDFYTTGKLKYEVSFVKGKKEGKITRTFSEGRIRNIAMYRNDTIIGVDSIYELTRLDATIPYLHGKKNGSAKTYYNTGELLSETSYVDDKADGISKDFYKTRELLSEVECKNDTIVSIKKAYYINGKIEAETPYKNNKINGTLKAYFKDGHTKAIVSMADGKLNGYTVLFWENGKFERKDKYVDGDVVEGECYDSTGISVPYYRKQVYPSPDGVFIRGIRPPAIPGDTNIVSVDIKYKFVASTDQVFTNVKIMPTNPGYEEYLATALQYPISERNTGISGTVYINFIVEEDGSVSHVRVLRGVFGGPGLDAEAVRVISAMPRWTPGMQNGHPVRISMNIPIRFLLESVQSEFR